jgi:hypothetical protein
MSINRWAKRKDDNARPIIDALVKCGCDVIVLDDFDLLVHRAGKLFMLEVKDGSKTPSRRKLRPRQKRLIEQGWPIHVVLSTADALRAVGFVNWQMVAERNGKAVDEKARAIIGVAT